MLRQIFNNEYVGLSIASLLENISKYILLLLVAMFLPESEFGLLTLYLLYIGYQGLLNFGIGTWLVNKLPKLYVLKKNDSFNDYILFSYTGLISTLTLIVPIMIYQVGTLFSSVAFIYVIIYQMYSHSVLYWKYKRHFIKIRDVKFILSLLRLIYQLPVTYIFGLYGYFLSEISIYVLTIILLRFEWFSVQRLSRFSIIKYFFHILKTLPFFLSLVIGVFFSTIERFIVSTSFNASVFASIALVSIFFSGLAIPISQIQSLLEQKMRESIFNNSDNNFSHQNIYLVIDISIFLLMMLTVYLLHNVILPVFYQSYNISLEVIVYLGLLFHLRVVNSMIVGRYIVLGNINKVMVIQVSALIIFVTTYYFFDFTELSDVLFVISFVFAIYRVVLMVFHCLINRENVMYLMVGLLSSITTLIMFKIWYV